MNNSAQIYKLIWMSRPLMQAAEAAVEKELTGTSLTVRMRAVLEILRTHGQATVPDIARNLDIKRQYVQLMINETLAAGLTAKRKNPRHKRSTIITLTDKGRVLIETVIHRENTLLKSIAEGLEDVDVDTALNVVLTLIKRLKSNNGDQTT